VFQNQLGCFNVVDKFTIASLPAVGVNATEVNSISRFAWGPFREGAFSLSCQQHDKTIREPLVFSKWPGVACLFGDFSAAGNSGTNNGDRFSGRVNVVRNASATDTTLTTKSLYYDSTFFAVAGVIDKIVPRGLCNGVFTGPQSVFQSSSESLCCGLQYCSSCVNVNAPTSTNWKCSSCLDGTNGANCREPTQCSPFRAPGCAPNHIALALDGSVVCAELDRRPTLGGRVAIKKWGGDTTAVQDVRFDSWVGLFDVTVHEESTRGDGILWALTLRRFVEKDGNTDVDQQDHIVVTAEEGCTSEIVFHRLKRTESDPTDIRAFQSPVTTAFSNVTVTPVPTTKNREGPPQVEYVQDQSVRDGLLAFGIIVALAVLVLFIIGFVRWWRKREAAEVPEEVRSRLEANANFRREAAEAQEMQTTRNSNRSEAEVA
jgi:hypothetical protein